MFRIKIALLSVLLSGSLLVGFGLYSLSVINKVGMARIDREILTLGEGHLAVRPPLEQALEMRAEEPDDLVRDGGSGAQGQAVVRAGLHRLLQHRRIGPAREQEDQSLETLIADAAQAAEAVEAGSANSLLPEGMVFPNPLRKPVAPGRSAGNLSAGSQPDAVTWSGSHCPVATDHLAMTDGGGEGEGEKSRCRRDYEQGMTKVEKT